MQCAPPPPAVNIDRLGSRTVTPRARSAALSVRASTLDSTRSAPSGMALTPSLEGLVVRDLDEVEPLALQPADEAGRGGGRAHGSQLLAERRVHDVEVDVARRERLHARLPTHLAEQSGQLPCSLLLRPGLAAPDQDAARLDDHHVAAFDRRRGDRARERNAGCVVEAQRPLRARRGATTVGARGRSRPSAGPRARVPREDLVRECWVGPQEMARHPLPLVARDHLAVLDAGPGRGRTARPTVQRGLRDRARRQPVEVGRGGTRGRRAAHRARSRRPRRRPAGDLWNRGRHV